MLDSNLKNLKKRKKDHLRIALSEDAQIGDAGFSRYRFIHNALPETDFDKIDTSTTFLGKKVNFPFFISGMTGGFDEGARINQNLAKAAQKFRIAIGVGSQRVALKAEDLVKTFAVRKYAPSVPLFANLGLVQLNKGYGLKECERAVKMVEADALVFHLNPVQEAIQPEGDRNFSGLLVKLEKIVKKLTVPVIIKEVGFGLSYDVVKRLYGVGVRMFDTAGWGGTNWAYIEGRRRSVFTRLAPAQRLQRHAVGEARVDLGELFSQWGIPTPESIRMCSKFESELITNNQQPITILGSGGVRTGVDVAKALCLGADLAGIAAPFAKAAMISTREVERLINRFGLELKIAMFGVGAKNISK